jgi:hypothetical protein
MEIFFYILKAMLFAYPRVMVSSMFYHDDHYPDWGKSKIK